MVPTRGSVRTHQGQDESTGAVAISSPQPALVSIERFVISLPFFFNVSPQKVQNSFLPSPLLYVGMFVRRVRRSTRVDHLIAYRFVLYRKVQISFEPALLGMFVLTLHEGRGLGEDDPASRPNPYVVATLGDM